MKQTTPFLLAAATVLFTSNVTLASGGGGFGQGGDSKQRVDQQYELGRSYYKGKQPDGSKLAYCVKTANGLSRLSRKAVKQFKKGSATDFINSLYNCNASDEKIADLVNDEQGTAILHYLNKRFKLRLTSGT